MKSIQPFGFYIFRRPLLSAQELFNFLKPTEKTDCFEEQLRTIYSQPLLQEAVYIASPSLYTRLQSWLKYGDLSENKEKFCNTLFKYLIRSCTRCTPYGMFAGCTTVGYFSETTIVSVNEENPFVKHSYLNISCMAEIVKFINDQPAIQEQCKFYPNNSLYQVGDKYRYTFYQTVHRAVENNIRNYAICSIDHSIYLSTILQASEKGATIHQLANSLIQYEVPFQQARDFVLLLIEEQILVSGIQLPIAGPNCIDGIIGQLSLLENTSLLISKLQEIQKLLNQQDDSTDKYFKVKEIINKNFVSIGNKNIIHTDLTFNTHKNHIGRNVKNYLTKTLEKLLALHQEIYNPDLESFKKNFYERYEEQEIPLLIALDSEVGVGYTKHTGSDCGHLPLLEDMNVSQQQTQPMIKWNSWKDFVLKRYIKALLHHDYEIHLNDKDLDFLKEHHDDNLNIPGTFAAFGNLIATSEQALDKGDFLFNLYGISGPSGANLLGRFCHDDADLCANVKKYLAAEEDFYQNAIIAEVVHLPDENSGNILKRPTLRKFEIPYITRSTVNEDYQIPLNDLMISVRHGKEIILRSRKHNKRVFPRLTSAHNFGNGSNIYRFLCDLQYDHHAINIRWHWNIFEKERFLPRVRYKNVILSRAMWTLNIEDYSELRSKEVNVHRFVQDLRDTLRMPRYVVIAEHDQELLIDLEHANCLSLLKEEWIKKQIITLKEYLQVPQKCFLKDKPNKYTNEIVIPFQSTKDVNISNFAQSSDNNIQRSFSVGSEWLYFKVYTGEKTIDSLLKAEVKELVEVLFEKNLIDQWFFIRYADPESHLRIRFHGNPSSEFYKETIQIFHTVLDEHLKSGLVRKLQTDTYKREIERYGNDTMVCSEGLFFYDSEAVMNFLYLLEGDIAENVRWLFALYGIDALLNDFHYTLTEKMHLLKTLQQNYFNEFGIQGKTKRLLDQKYRNHSKDIEEFFDNTFKLSSLKCKSINILEKRSVHNKRLAEKILGVYSKNNSKPDDLLASYIHMFLNRLFISSHRLHELVIYHYLYKYYRSCIAKNKYLAEV